MNPKYAGNCPARIVQRQFSFTIAARVEYIIGFLVFINSDRIRCIVSGCLSVLLKVNNGYFEVRVLMGGKQF